MTKLPVGDYKGNESHQWREQNQQQGEMYTAYTYIIQTCIKSSIYFKIKELSAFQSIDAAT